jgi:hypothetical protein
MALAVTACSGFGSGMLASGPASSTFATSAGSSANGTSYTFSSQSLGDAGANRQIVITVASGHNAHTISAVTVAGVSATKAIEGIMDNSPQDSNVSIWYAVETSSTSGDVVVTYSGGSGQHTGIGIWAIYNASSSPDASAESGVVGSTLAVTLTVPDNGILIAVCTSSWSGNGVSWSSEVTERFDQETESVYFHHGASLDYETGGSKTVTVTPNDSGWARKVLAAAAWSTA